VSFARGLAVLGCAGCLARPSGKGGSDANIVFVTSTIQPVIELAADADAICAKAAADAMLPANTYVPWLATQATPASARLQNARGWVRPDLVPSAFGQSRGLAFG
jgi:hypothetical protein